MYLKALSSYFNFKSDLIDFIQLFMSHNYYADSKCFTGLEPCLAYLVKYTEMRQKPEMLCFMTIQHQKCLGFVISSL